MASINSFLPIQEGTGDPSPENVRPIHPAVSIAGGKNLYNSATNTTNSYIRANNPVGEIISASGYNVTDYIAVKPDTVYTINYNNSTTATAAGMVYFSTKSANDIVGSITLYYQTYSNRKKYYTFTTPNNCHYIRFSTFPGAYDVQLEEGSEPTSYEPYQTLDVYGGYLDIANSRIVEEWTMCDFSDVSSWVAASTTSVFRGQLNNHKLTKQINAISDSYKSTNRAGIAIADMADKAIKTHDVNKLYVYCKDTSYTAVSDFVTAVTGKKIVYELETPVTHYLSSTQLVQAMEQLGIKLSSTLIDARRKIILNSPHLEVESGSIANFSTDMKAPLKECKIHFLPVQEGSGDPSPDNIRPITGWTGVNVTIRQALWDGKYEQGILNNNGEEVSVTDRYRSTEYISVIPGSRLTFKYTPMPKGAANIFLCQYDINKVFIKSYWQINGPCDLKSSTYYIRFFMDYAFSNNYVNGNLAITNYLDPYYQFQVSFGDNGTIYGGYVDLVSGEVIQTHKSVILDGSESWSSYKESQQMHFFLTLSDKKVKVNSSISSIFPNAANIWFWDNESYSLFGDHNSLPRIYVNAPYKMPGLVTEWKAYLNEHPMQICYELATPITYQLTPQQLKSLKGINNIWSDANGDVEVKFWKH